LGAIFDLFCFAAFGKSGLLPESQELNRKGRSPKSEALKQILRESGSVRNEDFKKFIEIAIAAGKSDVLKVLDGKKLSQAKSTALRRALDENEDATRPESGLV
jgi:hypothetical protein